MTIKRHVLKTISWRVIASLDTLVISIIITGNFETSINILSFEIIVKSLFYFFHERIWIKIKINKSIKRHLFKTFSWRILAIIITFVIVFLITENMNFSYQIGFIETLTKMILYFFHERLWYFQKYGKEKR
tara:strand:+ start:646 stop:1038 length:393 start_codon:yes stop_codon:yes gene_type:complete